MGEKTNPARDLPWHHITCRRMASVPGKGQDAGATTPWSLPESNGGPSAFRTDALPAELNDLEGSGVMQHPSLYPCAPSGWQGTDRFMHIRILAFLPGGRRLLSPASRTPARRDRTNRTSATWSQARRDATSLHPVKRGALCRIELPGSVPRARTGSAARISPLVRTG